MSRPHIVLITQIPLWSMGKAIGGPALHSTLEALGSRYRVSLVTPRLDYVNPEDVPAGVELHQFTHRLHGLFRQVRKLGWITDTLGWFTFKWSAWPIVRSLCAAGDVSLVYGYEIYGVPVARQAASRFKLPCVARYQGTLMSYRRLERLASLRYLKHLSALKTPADLYVMTDDGTLGDEVLKDLGHPADKTLFLMNGVSRDILDAKPTAVRSDLGVPEDAPLLLTVSRLMNWKRVDRAILALAKLQVREAPAHLVVVGVGPLKERLRELARSAGVEDRVHFVGGVARDELAGFYRASTMLLSLYDYSNLGNPVIEAMLCGCPVVALDVGGTDHLVHDGVNGVLITSGDPEAIAGEVDSLLSDHQRLAAIGRQAAEWADANLWSWRERMDVELEAIESLIVEKKGLDVQR